jgi:hypothetical protein
VKVGQDSASSQGTASDSQAPGEEEFDAGCMCIGNIDNASPPSGEA